MEKQRQYSDNTKESLRTLVETSGDHWALAKEVADFVGVKPETVQSWIRSQAYPSGVFLIRLRYFLHEKRGYHLEVIAHLQPEVYHLGRLLAHGILTMDVIASAVDLTHDHLLRVLHGMHPVSSKNLAEMRILVLQWHGALQPFGQIGGDHFEQAGQFPEENGAVSLTAHEKHLHDLPISVLANLIRVALPLAEEVVSGRYTAEERRGLRRLAGADATNRLAVALSRLCSEHARNHPSLNQKRP